MVHLIKQPIYLVKEFIISYIYAFRLTSIKQSTYLIKESHTSQVYTL